MEDFVNNILGYLMLTGISQRKIAEHMQRDKATVSGWLKNGVTATAHDRLECARLAAKQTGEDPQSFLSADFGFFAEAVDRLRDVGGDVSQAGFCNPDRRNLALFLERAEATYGDLTGPKTGPWLPLVRVNSKANGEAMDDLFIRVSKVPVSLRLREEHPRAVVVEAIPTDASLEQVLDKALVVIDTKGHLQTQRMVTALLHVEEGVCLAQAQVLGNMTTFSDAKLELVGGTKHPHDLMRPSSEVKVLGTRVCLMSDE